MRIKNRVAFLQQVRGIAVLAVGAGGTTDGLGEHILPSHEHTIHEYGHLVTLGIRLKQDFTASLVSRGFTVGEAIAFAVRKVNARENEARTLAAEIQVLRAVDGVEDELAFLGKVADNLRDNTLVDRVLRRLYGRRHRLAEEDAKKLVARIRKDAVQKFALSSATIDHFIDQIYGITNEEEAAWVG